jgi:hypothetical protein
MICKLAFSSTPFFKILTVNIVDFFSKVLTFCCLIFLTKRGASSYTRPTKEQASINIVTDCIRETLSPVICNKYRSVRVN